MKINSSFLYFKIGEKRWKWIKFFKSEKNERQKIKIRNESNQQRDDILPDTIGLEKYIRRHGINIT